MAALPVVWPGTDLRPSAVGGGPSLAHVCEVRFVMGRTVAGPVRPVNADCLDHRPWLHARCDRVAMPGGGAAVRPVYPAGGVLVCRAVSRRLVPADGRRHPAAA